MKIEKISENQLRFTLTREDLAKRQIKLSELAYGSEKARTLFREMMMQAAQDYGFEVNNIPLMVEAIPLSSDTIILIVTKVEDPEELDSRYARFSSEDNPPEEGSQVSLSGADDILDLIAKLSAARKAAQASSGKGEKSRQGAGAKESSGSGKASGSEAEAAEDEVFRLSRFYLFHDMETVIRAARVLGAKYAGCSDLYRNQDDGNYYLIIRKEQTEAGLFNRYCNILSEYAMQVDYAPGMESFFEEHMQVILRGDALQTLMQL